MKIPIYKYTGLGLLKPKGDLGIAGNGYELPAFRQARNSLGAKRVRPLKTDEKNIF